ncbi:MAG: phosphonate C-P lyase system protein PhnG [Fibrobacteria bacterium]|nr:phosphonate C-P lyase system protein PhnG [Fibrobacteria bacterium]
MREPGNWEVLAEVGEEALNRILERIPEDMEILRVPREGIVLMRCAESLGGTFHIGEVHVAEARVRWRGREAYAMVVGGSEARALAAASADAVTRHPESDSGSDSLLELVERERREIVAKRQEQARIVASTRVRFDLVAGA